MKKKLCLIIAMILLVSLAAFGCNKLPTFQVEGAQDTSFIVLSNGGSAVQYGNYVYFLNGFDGYDDEGDANVFGKVEKGAVYRAKLIGEEVNKNFDLSFGTVNKKTYSPLRNSDPKKDPLLNLYFETTTTPVLQGYVTDIHGEYIKENGEYVRDDKFVEYANVQKIAPKKVGTSGYAEGGIFIFDEYIFYATPSNKKDRNGNVQSAKTEFYKGKLDGSKTELIYTTENPSTDSAYMFYKYGGSYYLVVQDGDVVKSVKMDKKIRDAVTIAQGVTSVHFPNKGVYFSGMPENTTDDLVYILRNPVRTDEYSDTTLVGNVLEAKRPDGSNSTVVAGAGKTHTILGSNNGVFFYQTDSTIYYTNLAVMTNGGNSNINYIAGSMSFDSSEYTSIKCISPNPRNPEDVYVLGSNANGLFLVDRMGNDRMLHSVESTIVSVNGSYVYFTSGVEESGTTVNKLLRVNMFVAGAEAEQILSTDKINRDTKFQFDILPDFVVYFSEIDSDALNYAFFQELIDVSADAQFIGYRIERDTIPEDSLYPDEE